METIQGSRSTTSGDLMVYFKSYQVFPLGKESFLKFSSRRHLRVLMAQLSLEIIHKQACCCLYYTEKHILMRGGRLFDLFSMNEILRTLLAELIVVCGPMIVCSSWRLFVQVGAGAHQPQYLLILF